LSALNGKSFPVSERKHIKGTRLFSQFSSLNLKINSVADGALEVVIDKEDYSIADIIHKELMNVKHVKFAGVPPPHPLLKTLTIEVSTDTNKPNKALEEAVEISQEKVAELLKLAKEIFPLAPQGSVPPEELEGKASATTLPESGIVQESESENPTDI
jgi:DNA-directed RNA polymerase subunit L